MNDDAKLGIIGNAVAAGLEIEVTYFGQTLTAHPYLYGSDLFDEQFVYCYLPDLASHYKFFFEKITNIVPSTKVFRLPTQWQPIYYEQADEHVVAWNLEVMRHDGKFPRSLWDGTATEDRGTQ